MYGDDDEVAVVEDGEYEGDFEYDDASYNDDIMEESDFSVFVETDVNIEDNMYCIPYVERDGVN
ncbi:hypothetical protein ABG067_008880, partial [Albugo candida]